MKEYRVGTHERHIYWQLIKADNKEQAIQHALDGLGEEIGMEYVETLDAEHHVTELTNEEA